MEIAEETIEKSDLSCDKKMDRENSIIEIGSVKPIEDENKKIENQEDHDDSAETGWQTRMRLEQRPISHHYEKAQKLNSTNSKLNSTRTRKSRRRKISQLQSTNIPKIPKNVYDRVLNLLRHEKFLHCVAKFYNPRPEI